jgi:site-specific DNA-methyltransferase (adenine-specific)
MSALGIGENAAIHLGDCLEYMRGMPNNSVDAVITDPSYFRFKKNAWDNQWDKPTEFLSWLDSVLEQVYRILYPNGSLYLFASPKMAARVEVTIARRFNVLNSIIWAKQDGTYNKGGLWSRANKESLRRYFEQTERIIFAEHYGADGYAKGEAGYETKCDELRGFVFEPLRAYLAGERDRAGLSTQDVAEAWRIKTGKSNRTGMAGHWFEQVQWALPTEANYQWLRETFRNLNHGGEYLTREYEDLRREYEDLRREYEDLRREYEDLRRPFAVTPDVPYTDVWDFATVGAYPGKHPTEKPLDMMRHIVTVSTKPDAIVFDPFMGSGTTGVAAVQLGRNFIGCEIDASYFEIAKRRIELATAQPQLFDGGSA